MKKQSTKPIKPPVMIAVASLMPEFGLLCAQPVNGHTPGKVYPVYGGNLAENSVYIYGHTPKQYRQAAETSSYEDELLFRPLPDTIEEVSLPEVPGCYELVITNARVIPVPEVAPKRVCKVITHPAVFARQKQTGTGTGGKVMPLFPDYLPKTA